jgi:hypothetical protein
MPLFVGCIYNASAYIHSALFSSLYLSALNSTQVSDLEPQINELQEHLRKRTSYLSAQLSTKECEKPTSADEARNLIAADEIPDSNELRKVKTRVIRIQLGILNVRDFFVIPARYPRPRPHTNFSLVMYPIAFSRN